MTNNMAPARTLDVLVVIPAHNEEKFIQESINSLERYISSSGSSAMSKYNFSILIAEDGSSDKTFDIIKELSKKYSNILLRHSANKLGRGRAVKEAWRDMDADIYTFLDADFATRLSYFYVLLNTCSEGFDVVTGSRYTTDSNVHRPFLRTIVSKAYNSIINMLFKTSVKDHQCGFKAISKKARDIILSKSIFDDWFWDTEIFVIARYNGLKVTEFPIEWHEKRGTKTPLKRLLKDIWIHGSGILKLVRKKGQYRSSIET
jgi:glycosyltransferase AglD